MRLTEQTRRDLVELAGAIDRAGFGARRAMVEAWARTRSVSADTVYRWMRCLNPPKRRPRADRGQLKRDEAQIRAVLALREQTRRENERTGVETRVPTELALEEAQRRGMVGEDGPSVATINRYARARAMDTVRHIMPPKLAALPNDMHQLDCSGTKRMRVVELRPDGNHLIGLQPRDGYRRNRREEPQGLWYAGLVDDATGATWIQAFVGPGESADLVFEFLRPPWGGDPRCPIRGMPKTLNCDLGPFRSTGRMRNLVESLGVEFLSRMPNNPKVGGKIERRWPSVVRRFEAPFEWTPDAAFPIVEFNRQLAIFSMQLCKRAHRWMPEYTRMELYQSGIRDQELRLMPEDVGRAIFDQRVRKVELGGYFRLDNAFYRVPDLWAGDSIEIMRNAEGELLAHNPAKNETERPTPMMPDTWEEFTPRHYTAHQRIEQEAAQIPPATESFYGGGNVVLLHTPRGKAVEPATPFHEHERLQVYANVDEGLTDAVNILGEDAFMREPKLAAQIERQIRAYEFKKEPLRDAWLELRDKIG